MFNNLCVIFVRSLKFSKSKCVSLEVKNILGSHSQHVLWAVYFKLDCLHFPTTVSLISLNEFRFVLSLSVFDKSNHLEIKCQLSKMISVCFRRYRTKLLNCWRNSSSEACSRVFQASTHSPLPQTSALILICYLRRAEGKPSVLSVQSPPLQCASLMLAYVQLKELWLKIIPCTNVPSKRSTDVLMWNSTALFPSSCEQITKCFIKVSTHSKSFAHITELPARRCPLRAPALAECHAALIRGSHNTVERDEFAGHTVTQSVHRRTYKHLPKHSWAPLFPQDLISTVMKHTDTLTNS